jgi:hypothetical protein
VVLLAGVSPDEALGFELAHKNYDVVEYPSELHYYAGIWGKKKGYSLFNLGDTMLHFHRQLIPIILCLSPDIMNNICRSTC